MFCCSVSQKEYAAEIAARLDNLGLFAGVNNGKNTLPKKNHNGEIVQYNFILGALLFLCYLFLRALTRMCTPRHP